LLTHLIIMLENAWNQKHTRIVSTYYDCWSLWIAKICRVSCRGSRISTTKGEKNRVCLVRAQRSSDLCTSLLWRCRDLFELMPHTVAHEVAYEKAGTAGQLQQRQEAECSPPPITSQTAETTGVWISSLNDCRLTVHTYSCSYWTY